MGGLQAPLLRVDSGRLTTDNFFAIESMNEYSIYTEPGRTWQRQTD